MQTRIICYPLVNSSILLKKKTYLSLFLRIFCEIVSSFDGIARYRFEQLISHASLYDARERRITIRGDTQPRVPPPHEGYLRVCRVVSLFFFFFSSSSFDRTTQRAHTPSSFRKRYRTRGTGSHHPRYRISSGLYCRDCLSTLKSRTCY